MSDIAERLRNRSFRLATRDFNGDGAKLAKEAADEIDRLNAQLAEAREALEASSQLINRMMHVHVAPDECTSYVDGSRKWFMENGGSLAAIAEQQEANRSALKGKT